MSVPVLKLVCDCVNATASSKKYFAVSAQKHSNMMTATHCLQRHATFRAIISRLCLSIYRIYIAHL